jgi:hypothetical protein
VTFESVRTMANVEDALRRDDDGPWARARSPTAKDAQQMVALLKTAATRVKTTTDDDVARDWGLDFLQVATGVEVDMADRGARWAAFSDHMQRDAVDRARSLGVAVAATSVVLVGVDGTRYVRTGWFSCPRPVNWTRRQAATPTSPLEWSASAGSDVAGPGGSRRRPRRAARSWCGPSSWCPPAGRQARDPFEPVPRCTPVYV